MDNSQFNKNNRQMHFNQIKGYLVEMNAGDKFCNITLNVGHENVRQVNLIVKKEVFNSITSNFNINDKVVARYYITSRKKFDKWHTMAYLLGIEQDIYATVSQESES